MADDHRHRFDVHSVLESVGGEGMSEIMEAHACDTCVLHHLDNLVAQRFRIARFAAVRRRRKHPRRVGSFFQLRQHTQYALGQEHGSLALLCLERHFLKPVFGAVDLSADAERSRGEIQILPFQTAEFTAPETCAQLEQDHFIRAVFLRLDQQVSDLFFREYAHFTRFFRRELCSFRGVGTEEFLLYCFSQRRADNDPHLANGRIGHACAVLFPHSEPAVLLLLSEKVLDVVLGEL